MAPPQVVFVLGGPGAGKGTQCARIQKNMGYHHISAGDELRAECAREGSQYGKLINSYIKNGAIVPVEITCALLRNAMKAKGWEDGKFLIDGFPRNEDNLEGWRNAMPEDEVHIRFCLFIDCDEKCMEERLIKRGAHSGRIDDNLESIRKRFRTYIQDTVPIIEVRRTYVRNRNVVGLFCSILRPKINARKWMGHCPPKKYGKK